MNKAEETDVPMVSRPKRKVQVQQTEQVVDKSEKVSYVGVSPTTFHATGDPDTWLMLQRGATVDHDEEILHMSDTAAMPINRHGCLVRVRTQHRNPDGSYAIAEALTFVPDCAVHVTKTSKGTQRSLVLKR